MKVFKVPVFERVNDELLAFVARCYRDNQHALLQSLGLSQTVALKLVECNVLTRNRLINGSAPLTAFGFASEKMSGELDRLPSLVRGESHASPDLMTSPRADTADRSEDGGPGSRHPYHAINAAALRLALRWLETQQVDTCAHYGIDRSLAQRLCRLSLLELDSLADTPAPLVDLSFKRELIDQAFTLYREDLAVEFLVRHASQTQVRAIFKLTRRKVEQLTNIAQAFADGRPQYLRRNYEVQVLQAWQRARHIDGFEERLLLVCDELELSCYVLWRVMTRMVVGEKSGTCTVALANEVRDAWMRPSAFGRRVAA